MMLSLEALEEMSRNSSALPSLFAVLPASASANGQPVRPQGVSTVDLGSLGRNVVKARGCRSAPIAIEILDMHRSVIAHPAGAKIIDIRPIVRKLYLIIVEPPERPAPRIGLSIEA